MKTLNLIFAILVLFVLSLQAQSGSSATNQLVMASNEAQAVQYIACDTIGNSSTKTYLVNTAGWANYDSVAIGLHYAGAIQLDTLYVYGGITAKSLPYKGSTVTVLSYTSANIGSVSLTGTVTKTVGLEDYKPNLLILKKSAIGGATQLKISIGSHSSGNTKTDSGQKFILSLTLYKK